MPKCRLYGNEGERELSDILISTIMGETRLGPKIYGVFPAGRLEQLFSVSLL
jgi:hypothetical protein